MWFAPRKLCGSLEAVQHGGDNIAIAVQDESTGGVEENMRVNQPCWKAVKARNKQRFKIVIYLKTYDNIHAASAHDAWESHARSFYCASNG